MCWPIKHTGKGSYFWVWKGNTTHKHNFVQNIYKSLLYYLEQPYRWRN